MRKIIYLILVFAMLPLLYACTGNSTKNTAKKRAFNDKYEGEYPG